MKVFRYTDADFARDVRFLDRRAVPDDGLRATVAEIIAAVRDRGDSALLEFTARFDRAALTLAEMAVGEEEFAAARRLADPALRAAVAETLANVRQFAGHSLRRDWKNHNHQGAEFGETFHPLRRVGVYVPGGSAPLVSTALMTVPFAVEAGVPEIAVATPCGPDGKVNPALLFALSEAGATEVWKIGGAQAIAALAYGTASVLPVDKIFGPGNPFVVEAKRQVFGVVGIDLLPGPSEILVLADAGARADWVAADLLAQAEHGKDSVVGFITDSEELLQAVIAEIQSQAARLARQHQLREVLAAGCFGVLARSLDDAVRLVNGFAPEHLSLVVADPEPLLGEIRTAGAIYVGPYSAVAVGDFLAGPSHTLPTAGAGKACSGLTAEMFQRRTSVVRLDEASLRASLASVQVFARVEGLDAHGRSVEIRAGL
jgi:histidinol dehydrogenase